MILLDFRWFFVEFAEIHKRHAPKFQGRVFSEVAEVPQAATTQTHPAGRPSNRQKQFESVKIIKNQQTNTEIDKNRQNTQDTCSQIPGACFFWGRRSAAGSHHTDAQGWETLKPAKKCEILVVFLDIFQKCWLFKISKLKSWNVSGSVFRISKNPDMGKSQKS